MSAIGHQSDAIIRQLSDTDSLTSLDLRFNCLTLRISPKDMNTTCSSVAVFGLVGDNDSVRNLFNSIFGHLNVSGGLLSLSYIKHMETMELKRGSSAAPAKVVVIAAKNPEIAIKNIIRNAGTD